MFSIFLLAVAALASSTALADPDATPSAHARTTSHETRDTLYSYAYAVDVPELRNFYDHEEDRSGEVTRGRFRVALPDNRLQTVTYRAGRKGYSAQISYDQHPDFQTLRASVEPLGPIREGPNIGQSVVSGPRRGENRKNRKHHSQQEVSINLEPTTTTTFQRPQPTAPAQSRPRPRPRPFRTSPMPFVTRRPTPNPFKPRPTTPKRQQQFRPNSQRPQKTTTAPRLGPIAQRLTSNPIPSVPLVTTPRPRVIVTPAPAPRPRPAQNFPQQASIFVSTEGLEDPEILNRLIEAIRLKVEEEEAMNPSQSHHSDEEGDDHSPDKKEKPRYSISDKADVIARLRAIVHKYPLAKV